MTGFGPEVVALIDQRRAALRDLVARKRDHDRRCDRGDCPGRAVVDAIVEGDRRIVDEVLALAICELTTLGYGIDSSNQRR